MSLPFAFDRPAVLILLLLVAALTVLERGWRPRRAASQDAGGLRRLADLPLWLRCAVLTLLVAAAAGPRISSGRPAAAVVFLLDLSESVDAAARERGLEFVERAAAALEAGDRAGLIGFAGEALVESALQAGLRPGPLRSLPPAAASNPAAAIRLGGGLLSGEADSRMVLLSDGLETAGDARREAAAAAAAGISIDVVSLEPSEPKEIAIRSVTGPRRVAVGEPFEIEAWVAAAPGSELTVDLEEEGAEPVRERRVLGAGGGLFRFGRRLDRPGLHTLRVLAERAGSGETGIAEAGLVVHAAGEPRLLWVTERRAVSGPWSALEASGFVVSRVSPADGLPATVDGLAAWDGVIVENVRAEVLGEDFMAALEGYVGDRGGGLVMLGGGNSFGPGGFSGTPLERILPLEMRPPRREPESSLALVLVLDKSGSMAGDQGGLSKLGAARRAAVSALGALEATDWLGIVAFDRATTPVMPPRRGADPETVDRLLGELEAGGGTRIAPAVELAYAWLRGSEARRRHVLLLSDGQGEAVDLARLSRLVESSEVTLSAVGIGKDVDRDYLRRLVETAGGRVYFADQARDLISIFRRETERISADWFVERASALLPGTGHEILRGVDGGSLPELGGYVAAVADPAADVVLASDLGDPILAGWRFGLGRSLALTTDLASPWAGRLVRWESFARLWAQAVRWTARRLESETLFPRLHLDGGRLELTVDASGADRRLLNGLLVTALVRAPDGGREEIRLAQTEPGLYQGSLAVTAPGTYLARLWAAGEGIGEETVQLGLHVSTLPEHASRGVDRALLEEIARVTGGAMVEPSARSLPERERSGVPARPIWRLVAAAALALFLAEVLLRRRLGLRWG